MSCVFVEDDPDDDPLVDGPPVMSCEWSSSGWSSCWTSSRYPIDDPQLDGLYKSLKDGSPVDNLVVHPPVGVLL